MKTEHIEEFIDLAETLNFTRTAKRFYITQPVLSKHIAGLELELGGQLFERGSGRMELTPFGEALLPAARALIGWKDRLYTAAHEFKAGEAVHMRVGFLQGAAGCHIAQIQKRFKTLHPEVDATFFTLEFDKIFPALDESVVDIVIGGHTLAAEGSYVIRKVYEDSYFVLVEASDEIAELREATAADLAGRAVVIPTPAFFGRDSDALKEWLSPIENGIDVRESVHDINTAPLSVKIDGSVSLTFGHLAPFYGGEYELVPVKGFDKTLDIVVAWKQENEHPFFEDFAEVARAVIAEFGY